MVLLGRYKCDLDKPLDILFRSWKWTLARSLDWLWVISKVRNKNEIGITRAGGFFPMTVLIVYDENDKILTVVVKPLYLVLLFVIAPFFYFIFKILESRLVVMLFLELFLAIFSFIWYNKHMAQQFEKLRISIEILLRTESIEYEYLDDNKSE